MTDSSNKTSSLKQKNKNEQGSFVLEYLLQKPETSLLEVSIEVDWIKPVEKHTFFKFLSKHRILGYFKGEFHFYKSELSGRLSLTLNSEQFHSSFGVLTSFALQKIKRELLSLSKDFNNKFPDAYLSVEYTLNQTPVMTLKQCDLRNPFRNYIVLEISDYETGKASQHRPSFLRSKKGV